jgi:hypothetical protein
VDVYAPGVNIYSTTWNAGYEALSGTSMACPVVTGEVALILSAANQGMEKFSNLKTETGKAKVDAVKQILKDAATIEVTYGDKTMPAKMTNFAQVFNLSIADGQTVPDEPTISITPVKDTEDASAKVQVTITVPNNTVVYYTTNGSDPTYSNSEAVSDEIVETTEDPTTKKITGTTKTFTLETADGTGVVKAVAVNGTIASAVAEESFDLGLDDSENTIAAPEITITPAENERSASVKIKSASGTTIYYTTDGTTPVFDASNGKAQESTVKVNANKASFSVEYDASTRGGTIKAIAVSNTSGGSKSAVASETYTLSPDLYYPSLTATAASGKQSATVKITRRESYTNLYYTIDGSDPTVNSTPITSGTEFTVHASDGNAAGIVTIKAIAYDDRDKRVSDVKTKTIQLAVTPTTPTITVSKASNNQSATVTIKNADPGVGIYYTIDGTTPTASGKKYSSALTVKYSDTQNGSCTVKAIAVNANSGKSSSMASTSLTLTSSSSSSGGSGSGSASGSSGSGSSSGGSSSSGSSSGGSGSSGSSSDAGTSSGTPAANATISDTNPVTTITVAKSSPKTGIITKDNPNPTIDLSSQVSVKTKDKTSVAGSALGSSVTWTSSKPSVATVDAKGLVTMKSAGKTKITIKSTDKKHKKTTITITVKQAVTSIEATTKDGQSGSTFTVAPGKSLTMKVTLNGSVSKPTNKKLKWTINSSDSNVKINKSTGKITVKKKASPGTYTVTATAADGKGATMTKTIVIQ